TARIEIEVSDVVGNSIESPLLIAGAIARTSAYAATAGTIVVDNPTDEPLRFELESEPSCDGRGPQPCGTATVDAESGAWVYTPAMWGEDYVARFEVRVSNLEDAKVT